MNPSSVPVENCQTILARNFDYQRALARILNKVRNSVDLQGICTTTSQDITQLLKAERVVPYQFADDWSGEFVTEYGYARAPWNDLAAFGNNCVWEDTHLQKTQGGRYDNHDAYAVADIYEVGHARCHIEMLEQFQVRAYAIAPIFVGKRLWGLLAAYQHSAPRAWDEYEINFLSQAADYLGIAIQQDEQAQEAAQQALASQAALERQSLTLQASIENQQSLTEVVSNIRSSLDVQRVLETACQEVYQHLPIERAAIYQFNSDWSGQFIYTFGDNARWDNANPFDQAQVWEDFHLQETQGGRYRKNEHFAVDDIYKVGHAQCYIDMLEHYSISAYAIAPIFVGEQLWGLFAGYQHSSAHAWQDNEISFLRQVAEQVGVAIQQAERFGHSKQQAIVLEQSMLRQKALTEIVGKIRSSQDINLIISTTCQEVSQLLKIDRVAVYRFNEDWSGQFLEGAGYLNPEVENKMSLGQNMVWEDTYLKETKGGRYRNNETLAVDDIYQTDYARCHLDLLEQYNVKAYTIVPIFIGREPWGLLAGYQHNAPRQWKSEEVAFLSQVATQLAVAIQNTTTLQDSQNRAEDLQQAADQRQILFDVVAKIRESLDIETIFKNTTKEVRRSLKADRTGIFRFEAGSNYNRGEYIAEDVLPHISSAIGVKLEDHCFGENYATQYAKGRMMAVPDIRATSYQTCHIEFLEQLQIKAQIVVPLMKGTELWGLLCIHQCDRTRDWTESEIKFIQQVATQLSVALLQSNLLSQTQAQAEQLAKTVKELQNAQLKIIQSEKMASLGQLVAGVAHEINNPVNFIHGNVTHAHEYAVELLKLVEIYQEVCPDLDSDTTEQIQAIDVEFIQADLPKLFQSMKMGTERIREIVTSLRNFSRLDESESKSVNIHDGIDSTLMILQNRVKSSPDSSGIQIVKDYEPLPQVSCYPGQLNQVFMNILANAIDALEENDKTRSKEEIADNPSQIQITTLKSHEDRIAIHIADNGPGIPPEAVANIFDPFFTTKPIGKGTGLGLSISHQIITEKHHGKLYCHASEEGTEFVIELPIKQAKATV